MDYRENRLVRYIEQLPKMNVSPDFSMRVMHRIAAGSQRVLVFAGFKKLAVAALAVAFLALVFLTDLPLFPQFKISNLYGYRRVELVFCSSSQNPKTVAVAGDFSDWDSMQMENVSDNSWKVTLRVKPGKYQYAFVVDGNEWVPDPDSPRQVFDGFGGVNSVLVVNGGSR
ncbi:MAG: glycogen-binding domain-containing protein [Atribacterota bacterium]